MSLGETRLAIVGTGLIGASVGLAAKRAGAREVGGFDSDPAALAVAVERVAIDRPADRVEEAVAGADLVVVATPVGAIAACVLEVLAATGAECTITDVGSTKACICSALGTEARFVGGHPLAGSDTQGPAHASAAMFDGSTWFLTPTAATDPERTSLVSGLVGSLGAEPVMFDPSNHDRLVAVTSHLPHALANLLVNQIGAVGDDARAATGGSLRDMTRVAGANPGIWVDVFLENAELLRGALAEHRRLAEELEELLGRRDAGALSAWIEEAARNRPR
jgi:prephenate dehydrogenase